MDLCDGNAGVDCFPIELHSFGHKTQRANLAIGSSLYTDLDYAAETNRGVVTQPHSCSFYNASLYRMSGEMDSGSDHHAVAELEKVVVIYRKGVDIHSSAELRPGHA
jgi:hypothetical protein